MKRNAIATTLAAAALMLGQQAVADQVILDDLVVDGSICVGNDCINGESFGFDTLRLKENNLRIKAMDTSSTGSFPSNDWQITFNDSSNGGANKFAIDDIDGGKTPFTIEAGAPTHSLYVDDGGRIGLGTSTPVVQVHTKDGNSPTLRLEQDGSSGFTPQTWDVAGNEANFFIRDATNGSTLPFRIFPGAPSDALTIEASTGDIGLGTTSPDAALDIEGSGSAVIVTDTNSVQGGRDLLTLSNDGNPFIVLNNTNAAVSNTWRIGGGNKLVMNVNSGSNIMSLDASGNLVIGGSITTTGTTCSGGCDLVFKPDRKHATIEEHARDMWEKSFLPAVGPTKENKPFNLTDMTGGMLHELEIAHIYIEQLHERLSKLEKRLEDVNRENDAIN